VGKDLRASVKKRLQDDFLAGELLLHQGGL